MDAKLRDGSILKVGDEIETNFHPQCRGQVFIVAEIATSNDCESGFLVKVHLKDHSDRDLKGIVINGKNYGIDANWFKKITTFGT